jgi:superfamily II DNA or RNA helicase
MKQWQTAINHFCPQATVQILAPKCEMKDVDFYIINAVNVPKHTRAFYKEIGILVVDEAHLIMAEKLSQCMRYIIPRYVIGLTATPYRTDGLDVLLDMYFGKYKIIRKLFRKHTVYRIDTGFKPEVKLNKMGKVDWGSVLESMCSNEPRNELIIKVIKYFPDKVFLVLCKRVNQANYLVQRLEEEGQDVTSLIGSNQEYEQKSRILVGTVQKCGTGFDHPRLNSLILASDVEQYFVQYLGRIFRTQEGEPTIFDLVDDFPILLKHFRTRNAVYVEHGGICKSFDRSFPEFERDAR